MFKYLLQCLGFKKKLFVRKYPLNTMEIGDEIFIAHRKTIASSLSCVKGKKFRTHIIPEGIIVTRVR